MEMNLTNGIVWQLVRQMFFLRAGPGEPLREAPGKGREHAWRIRRVLRVVSFCAFRMRTQARQFIICICNDSSADKVHKIHNLTDEEAVLTEPMACAIHAIDRLKPSAGIEALVIGAGPAGLILAQLLKLNGASRVVLAANKGIKTNVARQIDAGDEYVELDRENPDEQWEKLRKDNLRGFDVVVRAQLRGSLVMIER